jgi:chromate transporter
MLDKQSQILSAMSSSSSSMPLVLQEQVKPTLWSLFSLWSKIGIQSFGGGSTTLILMHREFVEKRAWFSEEEYAGYWSLCQLSPGIVLVAMIILMSRKLAGFWGIVVSLAGMLIPSAAITAIITVGFASVEHLHQAQAMIQGVIPATAGAMLTLSIRFAQPVVKQSFHENSIRLAECIVIILGSTVALIFFHIEVVFVLLGSALLSVGVFLPLHQFASAKGSKGERA